MLEAPEVQGRYGRRSPCVALIAFGGMRSPDSPKNCRPLRRQLSAPCRWPASARWQDGLPVAVMRSFGS